VARVESFSGDDDFFSHYFADTICGLIEYLDEARIKPDEVQLFGLYRQTEIELETDLCVDAAGHWLKKPKICRAIEKRYQKTLEKRYKGHMEKSECSFEDRNRDGIGPI
jgi:hypothetical protein